MEAEFDKVIADDTEAIQLKPKAAGTYITRGTAYVLTGELDKAVADETTAIELDPNNATAYFESRLRIL